MTLPSISRRKPASSCSRTTRSPAPAFWCLTTAARSARARTCFFWSRRAGWLQPPKSNDAPSSPDAIFPDFGFRLSKTINNSRHPSGGDDLLSLANQFQRPDRENLAEYAKICQIKKRQRLGSSSKPKAKQNIGSPIGRMPWWLKTNMRVFSADACQCGLNVTIIDACTNRPYCHMAEDRLLEN